MFKVSVMYVYHDRYHCLMVEHVKVKKRKKTHLPVCGFTNNDMNEIWYLIYMTRRHIWQLSDYNYILLLVKQMYLNEENVQHGLIASYYKD